MRQSHPSIKTLAALAILVCAPAFSADDGWARQRAALVEEIAADVFATQSYTRRSTLDPRVMHAIGRVPRHEFVPGKIRVLAYDNRPLPIGHGQTISQPYIVALMTDLLEPEDSDVIFEVGTGSGYQAAVLAELVAHVYTVEIVGPLAVAATARLKRLGYDNVSVRQGDGYYGAPEHGPFDGIIVTAVGSRIPPPLIEQLKPGGRMILPIGNRFTTQHLVLVTKDVDGHVRTRQILPVVFVPLTGDH